RIAAHLSDPSVVLGLVAAAPAGLGELFVEIAGGSAVVRADEYEGLPPQLRWFTERGLLISDGWSAAEVPREVGLILRGPDWHAPFTPHPPLPPLPVPDATAVDREAGAA